MKINKNNWKEFEFEDIFTISRGKRLVKLDQTNGDIAYVSSSKKNNGVDNYITPPDYMKIYRNALTLSNSGSVGYCFYHPYKFVVSDHCTVIQIKDKNIKLNNHISLFLKPVVESMRSKYNFAREINNERLKKEKILLPITNEENPDWGYMEKYIKIQSSGIAYNGKIEKKESYLRLDDVPWNEFKVGGKNGVFSIKTCRCNNAGILVEGDDIFYIGAKKTNNGVIKKVAFNEKLTTKGNCIAFVCDGDGAVGYNTYQPNDFIGTTNLKVGYNHNLNMYNALFLISILDKKRALYSHGRKRGARLKNEVIYLPSKNGKPDFEFMENYIKLLPYSSNL
ncbi:MAG: restriction endonuclease subunit S [Victivallaceae bacterium]|nr:restriction endonuclease subunit S [Victivallaceae bacterium]